ncbi:Rieske (2Fe-2S) protein [bacterium]|nr:Rieske (2Fe-2S) protein [bacterium]MBU1025018.1 Rieske (2Fe-2S) protein [bacterium]
MPEGKTENTEFNNRKIHRRGFIEWIIGAFFAVGGLAWIVSIMAYLRPHVTGTWGVMEVAEVGEIPLGQGVLVPFKGTTVLIINLSNRFVAYSAVCTHAGCFVKWDPDKGQIICPCHAGVFDLEGNVVSGMPPRSLKRYRVKTVGEKVILAES